MGACVPRGPVREIAPAELADRVRPLLDRALLAFDVDGVLAPLVDHVADSSLSDGVDDALRVLVRHTPVALLSGRSLESLAQLLEFPPGLFVIGSHGLEEHGNERLALTSDEQDVYAELARLGGEAAAESGEGAWVEHKPASVVLHTRMARGPQVDAAVGGLVQAAGRIPGVTVKPGHDVVELLVRSTDKGTALLELAARVAATSVVFLGDDRTDEDAFVRMGPGDLPVRVGPGETAAPVRLADPAAVAEFASGLAAALSSPGRN